MPESSEKNSNNVSLRPQRCLILQPSAVGDCILTLLLAKFLKDSLNLSEIRIVGHTEYLSIFPGRTCIDKITSMESVDLHRLFADKNEFQLADKDPLIRFFEDYDWIITFLGGHHSNFEQNLIFTVFSSHSAEIITLELKPPETFQAHLSDFYIQQLIGQSSLIPKDSQIRRGDVLIKAAKTDITEGKKLLKDLNVKPSQKLAVIHPGSGSPRKSSHLDNFLAVAEKLSAKNAEVLFLLGPAEIEKFSKTALKNIHNTAKTLTNLSLIDVLRLLSCAELFVGNDSGITHLAAGLGIRTVAIFGPSNPVIYKPVGPNVTVLKNASADFSKKPLPRLQREILKAFYAKSKNTCPP
jgi:ADP-heptose:LPS heptosyltransferase